MANINEIKNNNGEVVYPVTSTDAVYHTDGTNINSRIDKIDTLASIEYVDTALNEKQNTLIPGVNIKNINNESILGSGNINISGSGAVNSVNGQTGSVILDANDVNSYNKTEVDVLLENKVNKENARVVNVISWANDNVRFYGEKGSVYEQGFSEFYGFPTTQVELDVNGVLQEVVCCPNDNLVSGSYDTVSGLVREFTVADYEKLNEFGGTLSGYSMLGLDGAVNGKSGCISVAIEKVIDSIMRERISFKMMGNVVRDGVSYGSLSQIDSMSIYVNGVSTLYTPLDGTIEGVPIIKVGEWFSWSIQIVPGYIAGVTDLPFYVNNKLTSITFRARPISQSVPVDSCVAKLSSWPTSTYIPPGGGGCYSYHTNYGLTIMKENSVKPIGDDILSVSDQMFIITPDGNIPVTLSIEDNISPLKVGTVLSIVANNTPSTINIIGNKSFLINGIRNTHINVNKKTLLEGVNIDNNGVNYYMDII